jgi:CPA1 family monovalent cation:H+ antiporter
MAGIMTLPLAMPDGTPLPGRHLAIFLASAVILVSLLLASVTLPVLLRSLELPAEPADAAQEDMARNAAAVAAINAIEQASHAAPQADMDPDILASATDHVMGIYEHRLAGGVAGGMDPDKVRMADQSERVLRLAALDAERDAILQLAREERINDETARKLLREIDLVEARYR